MVAIFYPYLTVLPGELPSGETHGGSEDPRKRGIWGELTSVAHGIPILTGGCETFSPLEVYCVLTRCLEVRCVPSWGDPCRWTDCVGVVLHLQAAVPL